MRACFLFVCVYVCVCVCRRVCVSSCVRVRVSVFYASTHVNWPAHPICRSLTGDININIFVGFLSPFLRLDSSIGDLSQGTQ